MWQTIGRADPRSIEISHQIEELCEDGLRLLLKVSAAGYLGWLTFSTLLASPDDAPRPWITLPLGAFCIVGTWLLLKRDLRLALAFFIPASVFAIIAGAWLLGSPVALLLCPIVALVTAVMVRPATGLAVGAASTGLLLVLHRCCSLAFLGGDRIVEVTVLSLLSVVTVWTLGRIQATSVEWSLHSYEQALRKTQQAQDHRGHLVKALRQLDVAYYQIQQANAALEIAWKAAEMAERSKSEFVTNLSHELRTPLNLIIGFSDAIISSPEVYGEPLPPAYRIDLNAINRSAQHLLALTEDVIDLALVGMDRLAIAREPVEVTLVIQEVVDMIREYVEVKGLTLRVDLQKNLPVLNLDRLRIRQVLLNLLTNAARFTDHGGITVKASIEDNSLLFEVSDTGRGIMPSELSRVFEEYYHDQSEVLQSSPRLGGVGLGLPISKKLVELHGGQMGVTSVPGLGTTFWFSLPILAANDINSSESLRSVRRIHPVGAVERAIVLVTNDRGIAQFLQRHLRGWHVVAAHDLVDAWNQAEELHAVAILTDQDSSLDNPHPLSSVPVLKLPLPRSEHLASSLGVEAYLLKPVTRSELRMAISRVEWPVRHILVVDDDARFTHLMTRMLQALSGREPYDISTTNSGLEALTMMETSRPDLVFLDLMMTDLGGRDVLTAMRRSPHLALVPVMVVSAQGYLEDQEGLQGDISLHRPEGFRPKDLLGIVEVLLDRLEDLDRPNPYGSLVVSGTASKSRQV